MNLETAAGASPYNAGMQRAVSARTVAGLTMASGALFVVVPLLVAFVAGDFFLVLPLAFLLLLAAMPGHRRLQKRRDGKPGRWGLTLTVGGVVGVVAAATVGEVVAANAAPAVERVVIAVGALSGVALLTGLILFGMGMLKAGVLPSVGIWVFLGGVVVALVTEIAEQSLSGPVPRVMDVAPPLGFIVAGLGLVYLGRAISKMDDGVVPVDAAPPAS